MTKNKTCLIVLVIILILVGAYMYSNKTEAPVVSDSMMSACTDAGGNYDAVFKECTMIGAEQCVAIGGTFNECASACRNDPSAEMCTLQCVQVCEF